MEETSQLIQYIESFVDSSHSPSQQAASLEAVASLLKNNQLTVETLVREMEGYLTTTDNIIRARGILLLGEVLLRLASKPLDDAAIHSLIGFFTDRLADWRALRGALVGCLALMRRKSSGGMVSGSDAKAVAESYLQNLQVQSLGQYERKLCFELLECLLERYSNAVASLGDNLIYGICEAVDGEKDPHCLMLTFHIIEVLSRLFPDPCGPLASFAHDLFEILGCYFPIHFTHPKGEDADIKRDDLARALMQAFSSTPLFEPFAIPLLLEKLSSSLTSAKVDSLRYLSDCTVKYGADRMAKHGEAIWSSLKDAIFTSVDSVLSFTPESLEGLGLLENEIAAEALSLLQKLIVQNTKLFLDLIVGDEDINMIFNMLSSYKTYHEIPSQSKQRLHAVGRILSTSAKASTLSCNRVFECFFIRLMDIQGLSVSRNPSGHPSSDEIILSSKRCNHGALYLSIELLSACRDLVASSETILTASAHTEETWKYLLHNSSPSLTMAFCSASICTSEDTLDADMYFGVRGLLNLATFPGGYLLISKTMFEKILVTFVSIVNEDYSNTFLWKLALKALVQIGSFIERYHESEKELSYMGIVIEKIVSLSSVGDCSIPFSLRLEALFNIGSSGQNYMLKVVRGLEEAIYANLSQVHRSTNSEEIVTQLLKCYSDKVIPWICCAKGFEEVLSQFAINIWNQIENSVVFNATQTNERGILDVMMKAMKLAVASCSEEKQNIIVQKSYSILSSSTSFPLKELFQQERFQIVQEVDNSSSRDEWVLSLFAAVIIAVHPQTQIPNIRPILYLFITTFLKGNVAAAQALGSIVNKLGLKSTGGKTSSDCTLEEAMDIILNSSLWVFYNNSSSDIQAKMTGVHDIGLINLCNGAGSCTSLQIHAIVGLAWIGKGLLMRGHEKVKDITMIFLQCLQSSGREDISHQEMGISENNYYLDLHHSVMKSAADAFQILMGDSELCLNREFHAVIRPLYKQRFFSTIMPLLQSLLKKSEPPSRSFLFRASAHIIIDTPLIVVLSDTKKILLMLLDGLSALSNDVMDKDVVYGLLLFLSGILMDKNGQEAISDGAHTIVNCLIDLIQYPHKMLVRETAIQCLVAISGLSHARIYPMRTQVLRAIIKALDDPKRAVRQEAVRCRHAWASIASRSLHF